MLSDSTPKSTLRMAPTSIQPTSRHCLIRTLFFCQFFATNRKPDRIITSCLDRLLGVSASLNRSVFFRLFCTSGFLCRLFGGSLSRLFRRRSIP